MDERRPVTILFTDIVGSTALAEKFDPEEWKEIVNGAHQRVSKAVARYEGTVAQLLGDGVLAFFGAPHAHEDDPARGVQAALEIQAQIKAYARELEGYVENFQMRVGINTGMVVVGAVGSAEHTEYLAVGDAVNLAARLQSAAQPGTILISETTARQVRHLFDLDDLGGISVKGKAEPIRVYGARAQKAIPGTGRGIEDLTSPLVGRDRELLDLQKSLAALRSGQGQVVFVLGEAGIGKSRLAEELRRTTDDEGGTNSALNRRPTVNWLEGRALSYGQTLSFWTITQLLQNDLGLGDSEPEARIKVVLRRRVWELFREKSIDVLPYLAHLMGVQLEGPEQERVKVLDGETLKRQVLISLADYFTKCALQQPTVLILEDLHWADPSSLEALERLLRVTERAPLMILVLMRAETDSPAWRIRDLAAREHRRRFRELELEPLSSADADQLVHNLLVISDFSGTLRDLILARAEGNPFYLEELIRSLIEQGALLEVDGHWRVTQEIANVTLPDTLQALLLARIDRLQDDVKRTLQLASVIGRSFVYTLLEAISDAERELDWHLAQLERADLVHEKTRLPELEYMFKHSLTQEAAYDSLLHERRREFHRRVGNALERLFAGRTDEFLGLLAYHFDRAGELEKAIDYLIRAGDKTRMADAHEEAIKFYLRACELLHELGESEPEAKTWLKLGMVYHTNFEFAAAHIANETAFRMQKEQERRRPTSLTLPRISRNNARYSMAFGYVTLDPGLVMTISEGSIVEALFAGIAELDAKLNLLPHAARSWEVLDEGSRYVIHLRDDVRWTDGSAVTAADYEWAWKRNLQPNTRGSYAHWLDSVVGARAFRMGLNGDPETVGVRALDALNLEIRLETPAAYFPYMFAMPITFPLPRAAIEQAGSQWWKPEHIVSNGAFRLVQFDQARGALARNADYFGEFPGNLDRLEWRVIQDDSERVSAYLGGELDWLDTDPTRLSPNLALQLSPVQLKTPVVFNIVYLAFVSQEPPLNDLRVRRALIQSIAKERITLPVRVAKRALRGGIIPPGIPGHSPDIGLTFDLDTARRLLAEAGFPDGRGFPSYTLSHPFAGLEPTAQELVRQWKTHLGITMQVEHLQELEPYEKVPDILIDPWVPDYPDPDGVMRTLPLYGLLQRAGWGNLRFGELVVEAARTPDRARRMAMYREADRSWVAEEAVVCPLSYDWEDFRYTKPWIKGLAMSPLGHELFKTITIEPH